MLEFVLKHAYLYKHNLKKASLRILYSVILKYIIF